MAALFVLKTTLGCALTIPNEEVCVTLQGGDAFCQYTSSDDNRLIDKETWGQMQVGRFSLSASSFGAYQKFVEQACEKVACSTREKQLQKKILTVMGELNE